MKIIEYNSEYFSQWDNFVLNESKNGNVLHTRKFLSYHPSDRFVDKSVIIVDDCDNIKALFGAVLYENKIVSHRGSAYGGLIVNKSNRLDNTLEYFALLEEHYKEYSEILFRKQEYIFDIYPSEEIVFGAIKSGYDVAFLELSTCLDLSYIKLTKGRKAELSICKKNSKVVVDDNNYVDFHNILCKNLSTRHSVKPTHTLEEMIKLKELLPDNYILISAYIDDIMVAGVWLIKASKKAIHTLYIAQNYEYTSTHSLTCIINRAIEYAKDNDFAYLNFGISTEDGGKIINNGLFNFKESFGGFGVNRVMYRKVLKK